MPVMVAVRQIGDEAVDAPETADAYGPGRQRRIADPAGEGGDDRDAGGDQLGGERTRLAGPAQDEDGHRIWTRCTRLHRL